MIGGIGYSPMENIMKGTLGAASGAIETGEPIKRTGGKEMIKRRIEIKVQ